jgi:hypothetical protein
MPKFVGKPLGNLMQMGGKVKVKLSLCSSA